MKKLLIILTVLISLDSFCQYSVRDIINGTDTLWTKDSHPDSLYKSSGGVWTFYYKSFTVPYMPFGRIYGKPTTLAGYGIVDAASTTDLSGYVPSTRTVNGHALSGNISVTASDLSLGNVTNTSDANKPVSTAQQTALDLKANLASPAFTGTPTGITAAHVGLGNVTNNAQLTIANNLSDLNSASTARTNLGLGTLATQSGTFSGTSSGTNTGDQDLSGYSLTSHTHTFASLTSKPTTILGYGITDAALSGTNTDITGVTLANTGLKIKDIGGSHTLTFRDGETLANDRTITLNVNGGNRNLFLFGDFTASGGSSSGSNTGDQTISITGDGTASGSTGALNLTVTALNGTSLGGLATGILKNTTTTGVPSIAVAGTDYLTPSGSAANLTGFPTLNQNTTGSAAKWTTARSLWGVSIDGSADASSKFTTYNSNSLVGVGVPSLVATIDATAQTANISTATLYSVPASAGFYRVSIYITVTQAATTSSTMPSTTITYTDGNGGTNSHSTTTTATSAGNSVTTTFAQTTYILYAKASTNIQYATGSYASSGGTVMQYALRIRVEAL